VRESFNNTTENDRNYFIKIQPLIDSSLTSTLKGKCPIYLYIFQEELFYP